MSTLIAFLVVLAGALALGLYTVAVYNGLVRLKHSIDQSWANIDVLLTQRGQELPKLVDTVKSYLSYERGLLEEITQARTRFERSQTVDEKAAADVEIQRVLGRLVAVAENYPDLKADQAYGQLMQRISSLEDGIADRREFFNHAVASWNARIEQIPDVFIARAAGMAVPRVLFQPRPEDRQDVSIGL